MYYDKQGNKIDALTWIKLFDEKGYKRVGYVEKGGISVSTVWLGLDHGFSDEIHLIFETMVFGLADGSQPQERYWTLEEAQKGHEEMVKKYIK